MTISGYKKIVSFIQSWFVKNQSYFNVNLTQRMLAEDQGIFRYLVAISTTDYLS